MSGMNQTPSGERTQIAFFGKRNAGKSSLVNAITGQEMSLVSRISGTTTDPVTRSMELLPLGPVTIIDTPGLDDVGELGTLRVSRTRRVMNRADIAVIVTSVDIPEDQSERDLMHVLDEKGIPWILVRNKADLLGEIPEWSQENMFVSAEKGIHIKELKETLAQLGSVSQEGRPILKDLLQTGNSLVLVVPIDKAAPKGRLILPQQMVIREALDAGARVSVTRDTEIKETLAGLRVEPKLVVTDSQVFGKVHGIVPESVPLTSFSILMARHKGTLHQSVEGAAMLSKLKDDDKILISEGCTHHRQCGDIGSQKLPAWIRAFTHAEPVIELTSGASFPDDVRGYKLVLHCGGCMLTEREMRCRARLCQEQGVPMTNYGIAIACMNGILGRCLAPLPEEKDAL